MKGVNYSILHKFISRVSEEIGIDLELLNDILQKTLRGDKESCTVLHKKGVMSSAEGGEPSKPSKEKIRCSHIFIRGKKKDERCSKTFYKTTEGSLCHTHNYSRKDKKGSDETKISEEEDDMLEDPVELDEVEDLKYAESGVIGAVESDEELVD